MIDLSTLKEGDVCVLRCGGKIAVEKIQIARLGVRVNKECWWNSGKLYKDENDTSPLDIISIERAPEPRKMVEYCALYWGGGFGTPTNNFERLKKETVNADKYFKITIIEGQLPIIEEVE